MTTAGRELSAAVAEGRSDDAAAALGELVAERGLDPETVLNALHVPDDAGEWAAALEAILHRIPDRWGRWISCRRGWYPIIVRLDRAMAGVDPLYEIHQVKQKFGGLRYYYQPSASSPEERRVELAVLVRAAEAEAARTCERCGGRGVLRRSSTGWIETLCTHCALTESRGGWRKLR